MFIGTTQKGNQGHMDEQTVFFSHFQRNLPYSFQKGLGFDVTDGAADFRNDHIGIGLFSHTVDKFLDFVGYMGNDLHSGAEIFSTPFFVQNIPVDLAGGKVGIFI